MAAAALLGVASAFPLLGVISDIGTATLSLIEIPGQPFQSLPKRNLPYLLCLENVVKQIRTSRNQAIRSVPLMERCLLTAESSIN